ncbi:hypothetical protein FACS1894153_0020 [Bacteroidia bacterium]|nr:hypothetical protein FACS1894153_0020 [Bacteroidia bacterium]
MKKYIVSILILFASVALLTASNIQIKNIAALKKNLVADTARTITVTFDISWDYSWKATTPDNWDAAWIFMKYKIEDGLWKPASITKGSKMAANTSPAASEFSIQYGTSNKYNYEGVNIKKDTVGLFLYRNTIGSGTNDIRQFELVWNTENLGIKQQHAISVKVFAIEMVYVRDGAFYIGDDISRNRLMKRGDRLFSQLTTPQSNFNGGGNYNNVAPKCLVSAWAYAPESSYNGSAGNASNVVYVLNDPANALYGTKLRTFDFEYSYTAAQYKGINMFDSVGYTNNPIFHTRNYAGWQSFQLEYTAAKRITWGEFVVYYHENNSYTIKGFYVQGSNDGQNWTLVHGSDGYFDPMNATYNYPQNISHRFTNTYNPIVFDNPGSYTYYKFNFMTNAYLNICDVNLFEEDVNDDDIAINKIVNENKLYYGIDSIAPEFPKGTKGFYVMKHELSQAAWTDFLNTLTYDQQLRHFGPDNNAPTNYISVSAVGMPHLGTVASSYPQRQRVKIKERATTGPAVFGVSAMTSAWDWDEENQGGNLPMHGLAWTDVLAYLDWAGLRPLTELEYEKMCRGPKKPVLYEYAWGTSYLTMYATGVDQANFPAEIPTPAMANNASVNNVFTASTTTLGAPASTYFPVRCGSFARDNTTREEAGASYWGILNAADNVAERYVVVSSKSGRAFNGGHGDGELSPLGYANVPTWPNQNVTTFGGANTAGGSGYRGMAVYNTNTITTPLPVSWRNYCDTLVPSISGVDGGGPYSAMNHRDIFTGCRGGRTAE